MLTTKTALALVALLGQASAARYTATLPTEPFFTEGDLHGNLVGSVVAVTGPDGKGVQYIVNFRNFPSEGGPFSMSHRYLLPFSPTNSG